jgi:hypothetical protein
MSKFLLNQLLEFSKPYQIPKSLKFKFQLYLNFPLGSGPTAMLLPASPSRPLPSQLGPFGLCSCSAFVRKAFSLQHLRILELVPSLSCHCHVDPTHQFYPSPHAGRSLPHHRLTSPPPVTPHRPASSLKMPRQGFNTPAMIPPHNPPR